MFAAIYMATDPVTMPVTRPGRIYYAFGIGVLTVLIRFFGNLPEGVVFAIVIMNMFVPAFDLPSFSKPKFTIKSASIFAGVVLIFTIITVWGVSYVL
jgi:electron transport complex protein RnfD